MLSFRVSIYFMLLLLIDVGVLIQINLDLTEWVNESESDAALRHDCLHVTAWNGSENELYKIISYCLSEWPSKWTIQKNNLDQVFTFANLSKLNITSYQLYLWSAPMDVVENYQFYLNQPSTSNEKSMALYLYHNCTLPRFGPLCQYSFDDHEFWHTSLTTIISDSFRNNLKNIENQTCYTLLQCNIGLSSICIDWWNICDGVIQCIDGIDEKHCWELEINKCKEDEYRCTNGQCIPMTFDYDNNNIPDCLDGSDERELTFAPSDRFKKYFAHEDRGCFSLAVVSSILLSHSINTCLNTYNGLFSKIILLEKSDAMSDICWLAVSCYFRLLEPSISKCRDVCYNETCKPIIAENCSDMFYMPDAPVAFGHIYFAYIKKYIHEQRGHPVEPEYVCYNAQLCGGFYPNRTTISFNQSTCRRPQDFPLNFTHRPGSIGFSVLRERPFLIPIPYSHSLKTFFCSHSLFPIP